MTDITKIAAACANRIFDRMEMCRGSAVLKSDIEREVEMALREYAGPHMDLETVVVSLPGGLYPPPPDDTGTIELPEAISSGVVGIPYPGWCFREEHGVLYQEPEPTDEEKEALCRAIVEDAMRRLDHSIDPPRIASRSDVWTEIANDLFPEKKS